MPLRRDRAVSRLTILAALAASGLLAAGPAAAQQAALKASVARMPTALGNPYQSTGPSDLDTHLAFFDPPFLLDEKGEVSPALALSFEAKDRNTWVLKLRPGVTFHNAVPFDAEAVVRAVSYLMTEDGQKNRVTREVRNLAGARALDPQTVEIATKAPNPILTREMAWLILPEQKAMNEMGAAEFAKKPVGTGAFRATAWNPTAVEGTANTTGWRKPKVAAISFTELPEKSSRLQALQSGQVHVAVSLAVDDRQAVERAGGRFYSAPAGSVLSLRFNTAVESPVRDLRVRQALNYGTDRPGYVERLLGGQTVPASQPTDSQSFGYNPDLKPYPYDPAMAKKLLAEAGFPNGVKLKAEVLSEINEMRDVYAQVGADLQKVGVELELLTITISDLINKAQAKAPWNGVASTLAYSSGVQRDSMRQINSFGNACGEIKYYCDEQIQPVIDQANGEFDVDKRRALVRQVMARYRDQAAAILLHEAVESVGLSGKVRDYRKVNGAAQWHDVALAN